MASLGFGVRVAGDLFDVFPFFVTGVLHLISGLYLSSASDDLIAGTSTICDGSGRLLGIGCEFPTTCQVPGRIQSEVHGGSQPHF